MLTAPTKTFLGVAAVAGALAVSGLMAVASGVPSWLLVAAALGGAVAGVWGGVRVVRLLHGGESFGAPTGGPSDQPPTPMRRRPATPAAPSTARSPTRQPRPTD